MLQHVKRHHYMTVRRLDANTTPEISKPTGAEETPAVSPAPPDFDDNYFSESKFLIFFFLEL